MLLINMLKLALFFQPQAGFKYDVFFRSLPKKQALTIYNEILCFIHIRFIWWKHNIQQIERLTHFKYLAIF